MYRAAAAAVRGAHCSVRAAAAAAQLNIALSFN